MDGAPPLDPELIRKYDTYAEFFKAIGKRRPTYKQYVFAKTYLETNDNELAWKTAGYSNIDHYQPHQKRHHYWRIRQSNAVKELFQIAFMEWAIEQQITARGIGNALLNIYEAADNVKDQIAVIRELNQMLGHRSKQLRRNLTPPSAPQEKSSVAA